MTQFIATPGDSGVFVQSFLQQLLSINFPTGGQLLLIEVDQGGIGATVQPVSITGLPIGTVNIAPGGLIFPPHVTVPVIAKPSSAMISKLTAWSTPYQQKLLSPGFPSLGISPAYSAASLFILNLQLMESQFPNWTRKFQITVPGGQGAPASPTGPTEVIVWFYASDLVPAPSTPFDPRIQNSPVANTSQGGWLCVLRSDQADTLTPSQIVAEVQTAISGGGGQVPVLDGASLATIFSKGSATSAAFASANVPVPPPFNSYTYLATSTTLPPDYQGQETFNALSTGIFLKGAENTYDQNFFASEGFEWWVKSTYGHLGTPSEAVVPPDSVAIVAEQFSFNKLNQYTKTLTIGTGNKTLAIA